MIELIYCILIDPSNITPKKADSSDNQQQQLIPMKIVEVDGLHHTLAHVKYVFEDVKGKDKLGVLLVCRLLLITSIKR